MNNITISEAELADITEMNHLSRTKRLAYEKEHPIFWKWAGESGEELQRRWFEELLTNGKYIVLVAKRNGKLKGFIIGELKRAPKVYNPGGLTLLVDDFCVDREQWHSIGKPLISILKKRAKEKEATQIICVCGAHDKAKSDFLHNEKLEITSNWFVGNI